MRVLPSGVITHPLGNSISVAAIQALPSGRTPTIDELRRCTFCAP